MAELKKEKGYATNIITDFALDWGKIDLSDIGLDQNPTFPEDTFTPNNDLVKRQQLVEELDKAKAKERAKKFSYIKNPEKLFDKLTSNPLIIGIVLVGGYFAYKKFIK